MDSSTSNFDQTQVTPPIGSRLGPPDAADAMDHTMVSPMLVASKGPSHSLGDRFGRYEIVKKLGEGGMGAVFQARDTETGSDVALKVLAAGFLSNRDALRRFEKEARLLEEAKSPHVANLLDIGSEGETRYLVMEFVRGGDLRNWMKTKEEVSEASSLEIVGDLCKALVTAHAKTLVHRDIKPENILLDMELDADHPVVKLTDFGLARHVDQSESLKLTQTGALLGTPYYK
jgi:serine/threonine protein kinase